MFSKMSRIANLSGRMNMRRLMSSDAASGHQPNPEFWRKMSLYVAIPGCILAAINTYFMEMEHLAHWKRPEFVPYEHLRIRTHKFPWGDGNHSLFHNPSVNPLPEGYEDEIEK